jgi:hypothetical protein
MTFTVEREADDEEVVPETAETRDKEDFTLSATNPSRKFRIYKDTITNEVLDDIEFIANDRESRE